MSPKCCSHIGRPRSFDAEDALEKALEVFWQKGYEGASLNELTQAMGINKPSMYAAFGNKEQLFLQAIELYEKRPQAFFYPALEQPTIYDVVDFMLKGAVANLSDPDQPQGCVIVQGALSCSESARTIKEALKARRAEGSIALQQRFERAQQEQDLAPDADPEALAHYLATVLQGLNVHATNGASQQQLQQVAELTLDTFKRVSVAKLAASLQR
ncbi:TetR/AcrR family transcriptional regulator [Agarivorans sp. DSG3-1]|uniref:TetR/AcrR family transcriptional regulator n=1 Tax=Agarivorans sp. DSG3-1 TaxID=3342249 RepID=UPI00398F5104